MKQAKVFNHGVFAGILTMHSYNHYSFEYNPEYDGDAISLTMPVKHKEIHSYEFDHFPPFFDGLLPEGIMLESLLKRSKIDKKDLFEQLITVGKDLVGSITVEAFDIKDSVKE
jgi:serine/threonine-protein kinase HipA